MCRALEVPTDRLVLELTEGATQPLVKLMDTLTRFRIKGIGLAIDDFGTGYSLDPAAQAPALHRTEDRPGVHCRSRPFQRLPLDRPDHCRSRPRTRAYRHRRGRRDGRAASAGARTRLRHRPGLSHLTADEPRSFGRWKHEFRERWPSLIGEMNWLMGRRQSGCPGRAVGRPIVQRVRLSPHVGAPAVRAALASTSGLLLTAKRAADLRP